ncbi:hypothetical protein AURDEDRAFT_175938 [Auricularia subglabra TFB-10046 SS5]|nr:hypothetical protein AURDEDRAFT_175938 [Auricularia subglabra TFB-10046 SS5]
MAPTKDELVKLAKNFIRRLKANNYALLRRYIELFGDAHDCQPNHPAGDGPKRAAERLLAAGPVTLARFIATQFRPGDIQNKRATQTTEVHDNHAVRLAEYLVHDRGNVAQSDLRPLCQCLESGHRTWIFPNKVPRFLYCEADASAQLLMDMIKPCAEFVNLQLQSGEEAAKQQLALHVRAQYVSKKKRGDGSRLDYTLVVHDQTTKKERPTVLIEFKRPGLLNVAKWKQLALSQVPMRLGNEKDIKYSLEFGVAEILAADAIQFIPIHVGGEPLSSWIKPAADKSKNKKPDGEKHKEEKPKDKKQTDEKPEDQKHKAAAKPKVEKPEGEKKPDWKPPQKPCVLTSWDGQPTMGNTAIGAGLTLMKLIYSALTSQPKTVTPSTYTQVVDLSKELWRVTEAFAY